MLKNSIADFIANIIQSKSTKTISDDFRTKFKMFETNIKNMGINHKDDRFDGLDDYTLVLMYFGSLNVDVMQINSKFEQIEISDKYDVLARAFIKNYNQNLRYHYWMLSDDAMISIDTLTKKVDVIDGNEIVSTGIAQFRQLSNLVLNPDSHPQKINRVFLNETVFTIVALRQYSMDVAVRLLNKVYIITRDQIDELSEIVKNIG